MTGCATAPRRLPSLDRASPRQFLRIVDLAQVQQRSLHHATPPDDSRRYSSNGAPYRSSCAWYDEETWWPILSTPAPPRKWPRSSLQKPLPFLLISSLSLSYLLGQSSKNPPPIGQDRLTHRFGALLLAIKPRCGSKHGNLSARSIFSICPESGCRPPVVQRGKVVASRRRQEIDGVSGSGCLTVQSAQSGRANGGRPAAMRTQVTSTEGVKM